MASITGQNLTTTATPQTMETVPQKVQQKRALTFWEGFGIGLIAGATEVTAHQPLFNYKNDLQKLSGTASSTNLNLKSLSIPSILRLLWSGWAANATGKSAVTAIQVAVKGKLTNILSEEGGKTLSEIQKLGISLTAGAVSAGVACPLEFINMRKQELTKVFLQETKDAPTNVGFPTYQITIKNLHGQYGIGFISRGILSTAIRNSGFAAAYGYGAKYFNEKYKEQIPNNVIRAIAAGATAGFIGSTITHPFDTYKTKYQAGAKTMFWAEGLQAAIREAFIRGHQDGGLHKGIRASVAIALGEPYRGYVPRVIRAMLAVIVMDTVIGKLTTVIQDMDVLEDMN